MKIDAISYKWGSRICYVGVIKYKDLNNVIDINTDISMNRKINDKRVEGIIEYIKKDLNSTFFPPTILSSGKSLINFESEELHIRGGKFTVIDGQHRIKAIITLLNQLQSTERKELNDIDLPVVIVEGLTNYQHRDLFYMINQTPKSVDSNVSERMAPKLENLLALSFFDEHKELIELIDWHDKQSTKEIVYLHLTECIKELNKTIYSNMKDWYGEDKELLYKEDSYKEMIFCYLTNYFSQIQSLEDSSFFRKKITMRALIEDIQKNVNEYFNVTSSSEKEEHIAKIKDIIINSTHSLIKKPLINYEGKVTVTKDVYKSIQEFLLLNSKIHEYINLVEEEGNHLIIINKFLYNFYENKILVMSSEDVSHYLSLLEGISQEFEQIKELDQDYIKNIALKKTSSLADIINDRLSQNEEHEDE